MAKYELPENLGSLTPDEHKSQAALIREALKALNITAESDDETFEEGERLAELLTQVETSQAAAETKIAERTAKAADFAARAEAPAEPAKAETPVEPEPTPEPVPAEPEPQPEAVAAAGAPESPARRAAANGGTEVIVPPTRPSVSLVAAADVPGFPTGSALDGMDAVTAALISRMKGFPTQNLGENVRHRYGGAVIRRDFGELSQGSGGYTNDLALVAAATNASRLPGGSLVAAGGWCAPSETLYDMCQLEVVDGILDTPEFEVTRGGIRWTPGPEFSDIYADCGFIQTEAQAIAGTAKNCCSVECPTFDEIRLDAIGLCVKVPILTNAAYPELTRRFTEGALVAHQHKVNKYMIDTIRAAAGVGQTLTDEGSITLTLAKLELMAIGLRWRYRLAKNADVELVAPAWLPAFWRLDQEYAGESREEDVSDAGLARWFAARNISVQWVYDYQDLVIAADGAITFPANVELLMYPAGTWAKGRADVINMDAVYDSVGLEANVFTAIFTEEGILAVQKCTHTMKFRMALCASGRRAAANLATCAVVSTIDSVGALV